MPPHRDPWASARAVGSDFLDVGEQAPPNALLAFLRAAAESPVELWPERPRYLEAPQRPPRGSPSLDHHERRGPMKDDREPQNSWVGKVDDQLGSGGMKPSGAYASPFRAR